MSEKFQKFKYGAMVLKYSQEYTPYINIYLHLRLKHN